MDIKEDDLVLCKVKKIEGTCVFVEVEEKYPGTVMFSEIAAGRIRNIREYVSINKQVVCKVLNIAKDHLELSLRRVTAKEKTQVLQKYKQERAFRSILGIAGVNAEAITLKIKADKDLGEFLQEAKENPKIFEKYLSSDKAVKVAQILYEKEEKAKSAESEFVLKSFSEKGVKDIKDILEPIQCEMHYLGSSIFSVKCSGQDFKQANLTVQNALKEIEKKAKEKKAVFEVKGK